MTNGAGIITTLIHETENGAIDRAVEKIFDSELVALPTETVYGLAADALNDVAVKKIYHAKGRPSHNPLICHVSNNAMAQRYVRVTPLAKLLMDSFWPGPLTIVLPQIPENGIAPTVSAGLETLAVRCPAANTTREIISKLDRPIAAPSANISGKLSPTTAQDVLNDFDGKIPLIIDGGATKVGIESTIVAVHDNQIKLLRPGMVTADDIVHATSVPVRDYEGTQIVAPGQLQSHYAPNAAVLLNQENTGEHFFIGFGDTTGDLNLSPNGDLAEAAHNLFQHLRSADKHTEGSIALASIPNSGIGIAINDRLKRASAPRDESST
ncbi:L-threonylcarbamoyladenylate synthase [Kordiimonas aquimaris]|uniref:L-threonylcarbamoyladenylate synthase n=1 Tax=Kordiimonas aquimaris TaxID=707591 RepID=UPI0021D2404A|nr:L-threonylcarbamoyladenylate synthase [Kordiimonas aquimaris]